MGARVYSHPAPDDERRDSRCCHCRPETTEKVLISCFIFVIVSVFGGFGTMAVLDGREPRYSVSITSVSGLDPATDLGRAALDPEFNLTLSIAARGPVTGACLGAGTALDVSYQGVRLAGAPAPRLCAGPGHAAEARRVAWGTAVRVPGLVLGSLAEDMRRGEVAFDVTITAPSTSSTQGKVVQCMARRVGDDGALLAPCLVTDVDTAADTFD